MSNNKLSNVEENPELDIDILSRHIVSNGPGEQLYCILRENGKNIRRVSTGLPIASFKDRIITFLNQEHKEKINNNILNVIKKNLYNNRRIRELLLVGTINNGYDLDVINVSTLSDDDFLRFLSDDVGNGRNNVSIKSYDEIGLHEKNVKKGIDALQSKGWSTKDILDFKSSLLKVDLRDDVNYFEIIKEGEECGKELISVFNKLKNEKKLLDWIDIETDGRPIITEYIEEYNYNEKIHFYEGLKDFVVKQGFGMDLYADQLRLSINGEDLLKQEEINKRVNTFVKLILTILKKRKEITEKGGNNPENRLASVVFISGLRILLPADDNGNIILNLTCKKMETLGYRVFCPSAGTLINTPYSMKNNRTHFRVEKSSSRKKGLI